MGSIVVPTKRKGEMVATAVQLTEPHEVKLQLNFCLYCNLSII